MSPDTFADSRRLLLVSTDLMSASLRDAGRTLPIVSTPCSEWQLGQLVRHVADSASALTDVISGGATPIPTTTTGCTRAELTLNHLRQAVSDAAANDAALDLTSLTGAYELTLHAWDIDTAVGAPSRLPVDHVRTLVRLAPVVLRRIDRTGLFGPRLAPRKSSASDAERLLTLFGRRAS